MEIVCIAATDCQKTGFTLIAQRNQSGRADLDIVLAEQEVTLGIANKAAARVTDFDKGFKIWGKFNNKNFIMERIIQVLE